MARIVKGGLIQATLSISSEKPIMEVKQSMIYKHVTMIEEAANTTLEWSAITPLGSPVVPEV